MGHARTVQVDPGSDLPTVGDLVGLRASRASRVNVESPTGFYPWQVGLVVGSAPHFLRVFLLDRGSSVRLAVLPRAVGRVAVIGKADP